MEATQVKHEAKKRLTSLQSRFGALETEARGRLVKALGAGQHRLTELDEVLAKWSREDWSVEGMRKRLGTLRARAEQLRETALRRVNEIPGSAVSALANGSRVPVQNLARELERLAKLVEEPRPEPEEVERPIPPEQKPARARPQKVEA
jgi:hypothetical protein